MGTVVEQRADSSLSNLYCSHGHALHNRECYANAALIAYADRNIYYVEGFAIHGETGFPTEHAWCETPDGRVIELTPIWCEGIRGNRYFAAVRMDYWELTKKLSSGDRFYMLRNYKPQLDEAMLTSYAAAFGDEFVDKLREMIHANGRDKTGE